MTQQTTTPWALEAGEHVCWQARSESELAAGEQDLAAHAARAESGLLIVGCPHAVAASETVSVLDPPPAGSLIAAVHERVHAARRDGRRLWVLAGMEHLTPADAPLDELVARELDLARLAAEAETSVVCAYRAQAWKPSLLGDLVPVHSRTVGIGVNMAGFWLRASPGGWALAGSVGFESLRAFTAALRAALARTPELALRCDEADVIDAGAWRVLVETVSEVPGASVRLEKANETVRAAWAMTGYAATGVNIQVRP